MIKKFVVVNLTLVVFFLMGFSVSYADDAEVLPKGVSRVRIDSNIYFPIGEQYNQDSEVEEVDVHYNTTLNSSVFPALSVFGSNANIGNSIVSFEYDFTKINFAFEYGITEKLTIGLIVPYWWVKKNVDARVDSTGATVCKLVALDTLAPCTTPGTQNLTTDDVQNLLGGGLDVAGNGDIDVAGYGYKRIETWSDNGVGDIEAGVRYQYLKTEDWRLAFTGGMRFPTGWIDDPDNLVDYGISDGAYAILFRLNNDYIRFKNLVLNTTFRYDLVLPFKEELRIPSNADLPITNNKEEVERDIGDVFELEASGKYAFLKGFNLSLLYKYGFKLRDRISGNKGYAYASVEDETDCTEHVYIIGFSYSTVPLFLEKKFPVPLNASISYRNRFAGANLFKSEYVGLGLHVFF